MWVITLTVCKFAGILITGIAGIISQLSEQHRENIQSWAVRVATRIYNGAQAQTIASKVSNTIKKESCLGWAIFGVVIALISQSVETLKTSHDDRVSKEQTKSQLDTAQRSLDYLERLSTRFDSLSVEVKFELDRNSAVFSALYDFADHFLDCVNTTNSFAPIPTAEGRVNFLIKTNLPDNRFGYTFTERPAKFYNVDVGSNTFVTVQTFFSDKEKEVSYCPIKSEDLLLLCKRFSTNAVNVQALQFIQKPCFDLGLASVKTKSIDLSVDEVTNTIIPIFLTYVKTTKKLYIDCSLVCPKAAWNQTKWMTSLPDLAGATFMISASEVPDAGIRPVEGNLTVDNMTTVPLTNFTRILTFPNSSQFSCVLPDKQQILGTK